MRAALAILGLALTACADVLLGVGGATPIAPPRVVGTNPADGAGVQPNFDGDAFGDACDPDIDGDSIANLEDACPMDPDISSPTEAQRGQCFPDTDGDGVGDFDPLAPDLCPTVFDPDQANLDGDDLGDACDPDIDGDGLVNNLDNCPSLVNLDQTDADRDGRGDLCDPTFCYVVFGDEDNCLDPQERIEAYVPSLLGEVGRAFRLPLFVNREAQDLTYQWTVVSAPAGSRATVDSATGQSSTMLNYEVNYESPVTFQPDRAGEYTLRVTVTTVGADVVTNEFQARSEYEVVVFANESTAEATGCAIGSSPADAGFLAVLGVVFGLGLARRRRRA
jgi:hypothetical protein